MRNPFKILKLAAVARWTVAAQQATPGSQAEDSNTSELPWVCAVRAHAAGTQQEAHSEPWVLWEPVPSLPPLRGIQAQGKQRVEWKLQVKRQMVLDEPLQNPVTRISWKHSPVPLGSSLTYLIRALWNLYPGEHPRYVPNRTESFPGGMFNTVSLWWWKALADRGHSLT